MRDTKETLIKVIRLKETAKGFSECGSCNKKIKRGQYRWKLIVIKPTSKETRVFCSTCKPDITYGFEV